MKKILNLVRNNFILILIITLSLSFIMYLIFKPKSEIFYEYIQSQYYYDYSTKEKAIGASDYVFIAKVNKILRIEHEKIIDKRVSYEPHTIYSLKVVKNIKGSLEENIEVKFWGGLHRNENKYVYVENLKPLKNDYYYLFLTFLNENEGPLLINNPQQVKEIGLDYNSKEKNETIEEYIKAYKNEEVPSEADYIIPKERFYSVYDESRKH